MAWYRKECGGGIGGGRSVVVVVFNVGGFRTNYLPLSHQIFGLIKHRLITKVIT